MKAKLLKEVCKWLVAAVFVITLLLQGIAWRPLFVGAAEGDSSYTVTIKLNGGKRTAGEGDVTYTAEGSSLELTHAKVREMFSNDAPFFYEGNSYLTDQTDAKGTYIYAENSLLYGLFEDKNANGQPDGDETLYVSGDSIPLTGDITLTCYYTDNGFQYSQAAWGLDQSTMVTFAKAWKEDNVPVHSSGERRSYTAREMQPLYMEVGAIGDMAFSTGGWLDVIESVEIPDTVQVLGFRSLAYTYNVTSLNPLKNVWGIDPEAFYMSGISRFVLQNINYWEHRAFDLNANSSIIIIESWQNGTSTPRFYANNGNGWFGVQGASFENPNAYIYVPAGKTEEWYTSSDKNDFRLMISSNENTGINIPMREFYTVTFDANGGMGTYEKQYLDAGAVSVKDGSGVEQNLTLKEGDEYINAKNDPDPDLSLLGMEKPQDPVYEGRAFKGWMDQDGYIWKDSDFGPNGRTITKDTVLTAQWAEYVDVTYVQNNGQSDIVQNVAADSYLTAPADPMAPAGYGFDAWYKDEALTTLWNFDLDKAEKGTKIYAGYFPVEYTIDYELHGGTAGANAPVSYTIESDEIVLVEPTKTNGEFLGWYDNPAFSGEPVDSIPAGSHGHKTFYAKWRDTYTITYVLNGGTLGAGTVTSYTNESDGVQLVAPTRDGYIFEGWYANADFTDKVFTEIQSGLVGDKTFYAKWREDTSSTDPENPGEDPENPGGDTENPGGDTENPGGDTENPGGMQGAGGNTQGGGDADKKGGCGGTLGTFTAVSAGIVLCGAAFVCVAKKRNN